jgi:hypothetical protein
VIRSIGGPTPGWQGDLPASGDSAAVPARRAGGSENAVNIARFRKKKIDHWHACARSPQQATKCWPIRPRTKSLSNHCASACSLPRAASLLATRASTRSLKHTTSRRSRRASRSSILITREIPRLCRSGSRSLTVPEPRPRSADETLNEHANELRRWTCEASEPTSDRRRVPRRSDPKSNRELAL